MLITVFAVFGNDLVDIYNTHINHISNATICYIIFKMAAKMAPEIVVSMMWLYEYIFCEYLIFLYQLFIYGA